MRGQIVAYETIGRGQMRDSVASQMRVVFALMLRQMKQQSGESRLGYALEIIEPALIIVGFSLLIEIRRGNPPVGDSYPLFLATGYLPFKTYAFISNAMRKCLGKDSGALAMPGVHQFDAIVATLFLRTLSTVLIIFLIISGLNFLGYEVIPGDSLGVSEAFLWIVTFGFGFGLVAGVLRQLAPMYDYVHSILTFKLLFVSGVFFLPEMMPPELRYYLAYNPLLHGIAWFRSAFIDGFDSSILDKGYFISWTVILLFLGLVLQRIMRARIGNRDVQAIEEDHQE